MFKKLLYSSAIASSLAWGGNINVAVAANVSYAINDLVAAFGKIHPDTNVRVTLGSSGKLTAQIKNGAPYQIFMSANMHYPEALHEEGLAVTKPHIYAQGSLAYLSSKNRDFSQGMALLQNPDIKKIAIANPKTAPYGKATVEAMRRAKVYESIIEKLVYGESISQTVSYTVLATDIGFIAKSSLYSPKMIHFKEGIHWVEVNPKLYAPINQGIVILKEGEGNSEVISFYDFIVSPKGKEIFRAFGYRMP